MRHIAILLLLLIGAGCAPSLHERGRQFSAAGQYDRAIELFSFETEFNPGNAGSWRELGIACYRQGDLDRAVLSLGESIRLEPDVRALLFLGLARERQGKIDEAMAAYREAMGLSPSRPLAARIGLRLLELGDPSLAPAEPAEAATPGPDEPAAGTIAVLDFDPSGLPPEWAPLGKGLAALTADDLAKVGVLRVIDRQALSAAMRADGMAAPRFGDPDAHRRAARAAGAGRVVAGSLQMRDASELKLYGGIADAQAGRFDDLDPVATSLERFFELQKDFLWALLDSMDLAVSPDEQAAIERNQTQSLPAFLAFCRGLAYEDQELSDAAAREYRIAVEQDGEFAAARARLAGDPLAAGAADAVETLGLAGLEAAVLAEPEALPVASDQDQILADLAARWGIVRDADPVAQPADAPEWIPGVTITIQGEPDGRR